MRPCGVALRHLLVQDAAARRHPLHVAGAERAPVAEAVAVLDGARQHVGDGLDAAMRMPREAGEVVVGPVVAEVVEQQERIELGRVAEAETRCRRTPAPSMVGWAFEVRLTARMVMVGYPQQFQPDGVNCHILGPFLLANI